MRATSEAIAARLGAGAGLLIPGVERKVRMVLEWTVAPFFPRDVVALGSTTDPEASLREAADPPERADEA